VDDAREHLIGIISEIVGDDAEHVAGVLLKRHRSLADIFRAYETASFVPGLVPAKLQTHLTRLAQAFTHSLHVDAFEGVTMRSTAALLRYLQRDMTDLDREFFRVFFLDSANSLLADRIMWTGTVNSVQVHPREVVREILRVSASSIIIAHNHPFGLPLPSENDVLVTSKLVQACASFDVAVQDHLIVARRGVFSMRADGLLGRIEGSIKTAANDWAAAA